MFCGVGILKVKSLFRKLGKLAVRYGGVIVFFDEADSLGNRGGSVGVQGGGTYSPASRFEACHGFCYLSSDTQSALFAEALKASPAPRPAGRFRQIDRKSTRLNSSHQIISYAVFCLKKKKQIPATSTVTYLTRYLCASEPECI